MNKRQRILVVDDTEGTRYAVSRTLSSAGFETISAANGSEALRLVKSEAPDLVTLDIHLPDINGFEVCRKIKADAETAHIPVLQVSASYVTSKDRIHGLEGGADSYLTHPFEPPVLIATVKALLRSRSLVENLKMAQQEQKRAAEEALLANQAKSRFLSNMSHEIRTPLGIIQGFADLALDENATRAERTEYLMTIKRNAENLTKLLGDILDLSKIEAGRVEIEKVEFNFPELLQDVVSTFRLQTAESDVELRFESKGKFPRLVKSDPTRVRQILINLLSNAIKFTQGGSVTLSVSSQVVEGRTLVTIGVQDTGIGVTPEQQARLFQAFVQADSSITRKFGGTGLGLTLSRKLALALGGDLYLNRSEAGKGSLFEFRFDAGQPADIYTEMLSGRESRPSTPVASFANRLKGLKILLVEDSEDNQMLFSRYLSIAGAQVTLASNGIEGIELTQKENFDAVLMDLQMPVLDGYGATERLRKMGVQVPIFALTAYAMKEQWERALRVGFTDFITKPVNINLLIEKVASATVRSDVGGAGVTGLSSLPGVSNPSPPAT